VLRGGGEGEKKGNVCHCRGKTRFWRGMSDFSYMTCEGAGLRTILRHMIFPSLNGKSFHGLVVGSLGISKGQLGVDFQRLARGVSRVGLNEGLIDALFFEPGKEEVPPFMRRHRARNPSLGSVAGQHLAHPTIESLRLFEYAQLGRHIADVQVTLGRFLIEQRGNQEEGCSMLSQAIQRYAAMGLYTAEMELPSEHKAREVARQLGCHE
jgi:hypothetical protein